MKKRLIILIICALCAVLTGCNGLFKQPAQTEGLPEGSGFSIHFIDVGQADAALVQCDGKYMLIDGGNADDSDIIYTILKREGVKNLDIVVGTHPHEDHIGGIPGAFDYATADLTLSPEIEFDNKIIRNFIKDADKYGGGITVPKVGDSYKLGSATVEVLAANSGPDADNPQQLDGYEKSEYINNTSIVLKITYGNTSFLFMGDAEQQVEEFLTGSGADLSADLLKVGHHGSNSGSTLEFLNAVRPDYAVISVGANNDYGHPKKKVLTNLKKVNAKVYRTDLDGDIYVTSDGRNITVEAARYTPQAQGTQQWWQAA